MINICGHLRNEKRSTGFFEGNLPLVINCCGKQVFQTQDYFLKRENGRLDYQLIYIYKGSGHFYLDNKWTTLIAGSIILFRPSVPQFYSYYANENPEIYWIHFTGNNCESILKDYSIVNGNIGENTAIKHIFQDIITELQLKKLHYEDVTAELFCILLSKIHRSYHATLHPAEDDFSIDRLIIELNTKYMNDWSVSTMADFCKFSESYFSHTFKCRMNISPMQYLNSLRIEKAKEFLTSNSLSVGAIAKLVGYDDPLYFSRVFKKNTGIAPHKYYQSITNGNTPSWFYDNQDNT